jgi:hypothetical protein
MSYVEILDPATGKKTRKELQSSDKWKMGKSREQGVHGVTQGPTGYTAQNPMISSLVNRVNQPERMQLKPITSSLLTNEGFNQAMHNVQVRNLAKMREWQRRSQVRALGSLLNARSQDRATDARLKIGAMDNATRRYRVNKNYDLGMRGLDETKRYHDLEGEWKKADLDVRKRGQDLTYAAATERAKAKGAEEPIKAAYERARLLKNGELDLTQFYDENVISKLDDATKKRIAHQFVTTGTLPEYEFKSGLLNDTIQEIGSFNPFGESQGGGHTQSRASGSPKITPEHITGISTEIAKDYGIDPSQVQVDYRRGLFVLPKQFNKAIPFDRAYELIYGGE